MSLPPPLLRLYYGWLHHGKYQLPSPHLRLCHIACYSIVSTNCPRPHPTSRLCHSKLHILSRPCHRWLHYGQCQLQSTLKLFHVSAIYGCIMASINRSRTTLHPTHVFLSYGRSSNFFTSLPLLVISWPAPPAPVPPPPPQLRSCYVMASTICSRPIPTPSRLCPIVGYVMATIE